MEEYIACKEQGGQNTASQEGMEQTTGRSISLTYIMRFRDIWTFTMRHALTGLNGCAFWLVVALVVWQLVTGWSELSSKMQALLLVCVIVLVWMTIVTPTMRSLRQANALATAQVATTYTAGEDGISIAQGEAEDFVDYKRIRKLKATKKTIYAYLAKNSAFIFPKDLLGEKAEPLEALLREKIGK